MKATIYLALPLMVLLVVIQSAILSPFPPLGVLPQILLVVVVAWTLLHGWQEGLLWALIAGVLLDLFSAAPLGVTSLAMMAGVGVAVLLGRAFPGSALVMPIVAAILGTAAFWAAQLVVLRLVMPMIVRDAVYLSAGALVTSNRVPGLAADIGRYYGTGEATMQLILVTAAAHAILMIPVYWAFRSLDRLLRPRKVEI